MLGRAGARGSNDVIYRYFAGQTLLTTSQSRSRTE